MYSICVYFTKVKPNNCFNLINPLSWFVQNNNAQTTPSLRNSSGTDLKVKPMLDGRLRRKSRHVESFINYVNPMYDRFAFSEKK